MQIRKTFIRGGAAVLLAGIAGAGTPALAIPGSGGWQRPIVFTIPGGSGDQFEHAFCPKGYVAINGAAFAVTNTTVANGFKVTGAGPRLDLTPPTYNEWVWNFEWDAPGALAGSQIIVNVDCRRGPA